MVVAPGAQLDEPGLRTPRERDRSRSAAAGATRARPVTGALSGWRTGPGRQPRQPDLADPPGFRARRGPCLPRGDALAGALPPRARRDRLAGNGRTRLRGDRRRQLRRVGEAPNGEAGQRGLVVASAIVASRRGFVAAPGGFPWAARAR